MIEFSIPYGLDGMTGTIAEKNLLGIFHAQVPPAAEDENAEVIRALDNPIGSPKLEELAAKADNAVIIASDHTRPVPSRIIMPHLLKRLRQGNPAIKISILIATGCHRESTREELIRKFGQEIVDHERIIIHDAKAEEQFTEIGILPSGGKLIINKLAAETDLLLAEGFIEPHFFAGFSGGRKSVLPGVAARQTVLANHCAEFIMNPNARTGQLQNNPIHQDMLYAAEKAGLAFILNVVINSEKKIVSAFAGDMKDAHRAGTDFLKKFAGIQSPEADIVITGNGGYPLDQNVYQQVKGMTAGEAVVRDGGVIILCASCSDGHGGEGFYRNLSQRKPSEILAHLQSVARDQTEPDQWQYQILARILVRHTVILVSNHCDHHMLQQMGLKTAHSIEEALQTAYAICGDDAGVAIIPDGVSVIAEKTGL